MARRGRPRLHSSPATRATRSNARPASQPVSARKGAKRGSQLSSNVASSPVKSRIGASSGTRGAEQARKVAAEPEDIEDSEQPAEEEVEEEEEENENDEDAEDTRPHDTINNSVLSGDTAVSLPDRNSEVQHLKTNMAALIGMLPDLNDDASRVLRVLAPRNATAESVEKLAVELGDKNSGPRSLLDRCEHQFLDSFGKFKGSSPYIRPDLFHTALFGNEPVSRAAVFRPDDILYKANLAKLATVIMNFFGDSQFPSARKDTHPVLKYLVDFFPRIFFNALTKHISASGESSLISETFSVALALRTQLAINLLFNDTETDSAQLIYSAFTTTPIPDSSEDITEVEIRGWYMPGLEDIYGALQPEYQEKVHQRCFMLLETVGADGVVNFEELKTGAPWLEFQTEMTMWVKARAREIDAQISKQQGADEVASSLEAEVKQRRETPGEGSFFSRLSGMDPKSMAKAVAARARSLGGSAIMPASTRPQQAEAADADDSIAVSKRVEAAAAKTPKSAPAPTRMRLLDRQPTAQKIDFADSQSSQAPPRPRASQSATQQEPVTQDGGFQTSSATASAKKRGDKRRITSGTDTHAQTEQAQPPAKRRRTQQQNDEERVEPRKRGRPAAASREEPEVGEDEAEERQSAATPSTRYEEVNSGARHVTNMRDVNREPQRRTFWSTEECDSLIYYIGAYGTSWVKIKAMDEDTGRNVLRIRDQVALKDKARNMKFDYLKAGVPLPANFDRIPLDKKLRDKLASFGIDADA